MSKPNVDPDSPPEEIINKRVTFYYERTYLRRELLDNKKSAIINDSSHPSNLILIYLIPEKALNLTAKFIF